MPPLESWFCCRFLPGSCPLAPTRDPPSHTLTRIDPSVSAGTPGPSDRFCWLLLSRNIATHFAFVLPLITAWRPRLGRAPGHLLPASAGGGGQACTWLPRGGLWLRRWSSSLISHKYLSGVGCVQRASESRAETWCHRGEGRSRHTETWGNRGGA